MKKKSVVEGYVGRMSRAFEVYKEAVLAHTRGQTYSPNDSTIMEQTEKCFEFMGDVNDFRKALAEFYFFLKRQNKPMTWESHPVVKLGMLKGVGLTEEYWLILTEEKKHRSIDDPWET
jgi:predicted Ser/Thr protein kinase